MGILKDDRGQMNPVATVMFVILGIAVALTVTVDLVNDRVASSNTTLNFTSTDRNETIANGWRTWNSLANTSTTLTLNTDYRIFENNQTVQLIVGGASNVSGCGPPHNIGSCNYFATYFTTDATTRTILTLLPLLLGIAVFVGVAAVFMRRG